MQVLDCKETKNMNHRYKNLSKHLRSCQTLKEQVSSLQSFYNEQNFKRIDLIRRMRELERSFKYDSEWYGEQFFSHFFAFFLGVFLEHLFDQPVLTIIICMLLLLGLARFSLNIDLKKLRKDENQLFEINLIELETIKTVLVQNEQEININSLIEQIYLKKSYFNFFPKSKK